MGAFVALGTRASVDGSTRSSPSAARPTAASRGCRAPGCSARCAPGRAGRKPARPLRHARRPDADAGRHRRRSISPRESPSRRDRPRGPRPLRAGERRPRALRPAPASRGCSSCSPGSVTPRPASTTTSPSCSNDSSRACSRARTSSKRDVGRAHGGTFVGTTSQTRAGERSQSMGSKTTTSVDGASRLGGVPTVLPPPAPPGTGAGRPARARRPRAGAGAQPRARCCRARCTSPTGSTSTRNVAWSSSSASGRFRRPGSAIPGCPTGHLMSVQSVCLGWHWYPYVYTPHRGRHRRRAGEAAPSRDRRPARAAAVDDAYGAGSPAAHRRSRPTPRS